MEVPPLLDRHSPSPFEIQHLKGCTSSPIPSNPGTSPSGASPLYISVATCGGSVSERIERALQLQRARLYGYALSLTRDRESARDLLQDCAVKALSASSAPTDDAALRAWLFRILRNAWIDRIRRDRPELAEVPESAAPSEYWSHDARLISTIAVRQAMERMPAAYRDIIALVDLGGFAYAEAAAILDVPIGTVMSRLSRARLGLLEKLAENNVRPLRANRRSEQKSR